MNLRRAVPALACALVASLAVGTGAAAASVPAKKHPKKPHKAHVAKKKVAPAPKPVCLIGQSPQLGKSCTANPLFAKTICASFVPWLQAAAPGVQFAAGYDMNGSAFGAVHCFWDHQAWGLSVGSMLGATDQQGNKVTPQQAFEAGIQEDTQTWNNPDNETCSDGVKSEVPKQTTIAGYPAYTEDPCTPGTGRSNVVVLVGNAEFSATTVPGTSAQMTPLVEQLIEKYKAYLP